MLGSTLCAWRRHGSVILARALQGLGGGGLMTLAQATIADVVSPRERGAMPATSRSCWGGSSVLGPMLGGIVTQRYGWPWIFWINLPLGLAALLVAIALAQAAGGPSALADRTMRHPAAVRGHRRAASHPLARRQRLPGRGRNRWRSLPPPSFSAASSCATRSARRKPIVPPHFLRDRVIRRYWRRSSSSSEAISRWRFLAPIYFQVALGMSVSDAGLLMIPLGLASVLTANLAGQNTRKTGRYKRPPLLGMPIAIVVLAIVAFYADRLSRRWPPSLSWCRSRRRPDLSLCHGRRSERRARGLSAR